MLDFEFYTDTDDSVPVCCRQASYRFNERKIVNRHIVAIKNSGLIVDCEGPLDWLLVFATKPHQEDYISSMILFGDYALAIDPST